MRLPPAAAAFALLAPWGAQGACTVSGATLAFGVYTGALSNSGTGSVTVTCDAFMPYAIGVGPGLHSGGGSYNANMGGPASRLLHYELFRDAGRTLRWGNARGSDTIAGTGTGSAQTMNFYARIPANAAVAPGAYADTATIFAYSPFTTATASMNVAATVPSNCTISASPLNFGAYAGAALDATTQLAVRCTNTTPFYVNLDNGLRSICCWSNRMLGPGAQLLTYRLFQDAARTVPWWNTVNSDGQAGTGTGGTQTLTVYGRTFAGQNVGPGSYADTVIVRITY